MLFLALPVIVAVYGIVLLIVCAAQRRRRQNMYDQIMSSTKESEQTKQPAEDMEKRISQLKEHLDSGLITKEEYKAGRDELRKENASS